MKSMFLKVTVTSFAVSPCGLKNLDRFHHPFAITDPTVWLAFFKGSNNRKELNPIHGLSDARQWQPNSFMRISIRSYSTSFVMQFTAVSARAISPHCTLPSPVASVWRKLNATLALLASALGAHQHAWHPTAG
eukprot:2301005-Amphidinium_carterae.2